MTIFVSIAAYRDPELKQTINSLVNNSSDSLHVSVVEQCMPRERIRIEEWESERVRISLRWMHPLSARGAGYARHMALNPYTTEEYFLQVDSHTDFADNWDSKMKATLHKAQEIEGSKKIILSQYPAAYDISTGRQRERLVNHTRYKGYSQKTVPKISKMGQISSARKEKETDQPELSTSLLAGYIFAEGNFTELGYDPNITFWGEEFNLAIKAWINGWRIYSPHEMYLWHHYGRHHYDKVWNDLDNWRELDEESLQYQEDYFKELQLTTDWNLLHDDHRNTITKWLEIREDQKKQNFTEQSIEDWLAQ